VWACGRFYRPISHQACGIYHVKEGKVAISFCLHTELDVLMETDQVVKELSQLAWSMWTLRG
jgi:hypothetical protein